MPKLLTTLSVTALLAFATPLFAQTATPTEAPAADAGTTTDAAKPDTALSLGQTSPDGPGTAYVKQQAAAFKTVIDLASRLRAGLLLPKTLPAAAAS